MRYASVRVLFGYSDYSEQVEKKLWMYTFCSSERRKLLRTFCFFCKIEEESPILLRGIHAKDVDYIPIIILIIICLENKLFK